ncbi:dephospho-CoA kinase [Thermoleophilia bacterium SCSIO 60948]|nr:dephospho-CoA kinase [Thermoleophilia bacterium SCSIO 60948]
MGLTGAMASGKSAALAALGELGALTLSADETVHELLGRADVVERLVERWGEEVAPGGEIERARVGQIVFADPDELAWLESVLHPLVGERTVEWIGELPEGATLAVVETPLLYEAGLADRFDAVLVVASDDELRAERAGARGTDELEGRERRQLSQDEKVSRADFVVRNDSGLDDLEAALAELWPELREAGRRS